MVKKSTIKKQPVVPAPESVTSKREFRWWVPIGVVVDGGPVVTGERREGDPLEDSLLIKLEPELLDWLTKNGYRVADTVASERPYIGNQHGAETKFRREPKSDTIPPNEDDSSTPEYATWSISELRSECERLEIDTRGSKVKLIERLLAL